MPAENRIFEIVSAVGCTIEFGPMPRQPTKAWLQLIFPSGSLLYFLETQVCSRLFPHRIVFNPDEPGTESIAVINLFSQPAESLISFAENLIDRRDPVFDDMLTAGVAPQQLI